MSGDSVQTRGSQEVHHTSKLGIAGLIAVAVLISHAACTGRVGDPAGQVSGGRAGMSGTGSGAGAGTGATAGGAVGTGTAGTSGIIIPASAPAAVLVPTARLARLSHMQWANSVRDLLKVTDISDVEPNVIGDAIVGFDNDVESLFVTETLRSDLANAAVKLAQKVVGDPIALARLVPANAPTDLAGKARAFIAAIGLRAYRRPLTNAEINEAAGLFNQGPTLYPGIDPFVAGVNLVLQLMLQSPHFLYRTELGTVVANGKVPLGDYEVASKISYATTNTMPDDALFAAAAAGQLTAPASVLAHAARLLSSEAGALGRDHLHFQVLRLGAYDGITRDMTAFPQFTAATPAAMRQEALLFLRWIFDQGYGVKEIYTSPVGFVNNALAPLYQLPGTFGVGFTRVDLDPKQRSGLLTQAGVLSQYAVANDPDSIHRGVFVNQRILCFTLPPPDPKAHPLIDLQPNMTNRERVEATTGAGTCGEGCHSSWINTAGFAFEEYDALGKYRTTDRGKPVNASDAYPFVPEGLQAYDDAIGFSKAISQSTQAHTCYTRNWMTYLNGRAVAPAEVPLADYWALLSRAGKLSMKDLVLAMVTSDAFVNRLP